ncbi:MAG: ATP-binding protein [Nitrospirae bacterium YQR-1]
MTLITGTVLIVQSDLNIIRQISSKLPEIFNIETTDTLSGAFKHLSSGAIDVVILDLFLFDSSGIDTFLKLRLKYPDIPAILLLDYENSKLIKEAMFHGAQDYLIKEHFDDSFLIHVVESSILRQSYLTKMQITVERQYFSIFKKSMDGILIVDMDGIVQLINPAAELLFDRHSEEIKDQPFGFPLVTGKEADIEILRKDGTIVLAVMRLTVIEWEGQLVYLIMLNDVTDKKKVEIEKQKMQIKILSASKMATLGEVATGMAHEINQPLTYISTFVQGIVEDFKRNTLDFKSLADEAHIAYNQIKRITDIINHLRTFGRRDVVMQKNASDITKILDYSLLLINKRLALKNIVFEKVIEPNLPLVLLNPNQIEQVFINLFINAIDALENRNHNAKIIVEIATCSDSNQVAIKFIDNGTGIWEKAIDKIFEPFYTTKPVGKGTGLGLSITYGIIESHNGSITCESTINEGTCFTIKLPVALSMVSET